MKAGPFWNVTASTRPEAEEAVFELMQRIFGVPAAVYQDAATGRTRVTATLSRRPGRDDPAMGRLRHDLRRLREVGLVTATPRISLVRLRRQDWAESWKRHFPPMEIGGTLLLRPSWSRRKVRRGLLSLTLDPGLSFGTGHHATTRYCLEELVRLRPARPGAHGMLDVGTGSGILAIAAARLGYRPVEAFDIDPDSLGVARVNARRNRVQHRIRYVRRNLAAGGRRVGARRYRVICANLSHDLLLSCRSALLDLLEPGGTLILAGILARQFPEVAAAYEGAGGVPARSRREKEWRSGSFTFGAGAG